MAENDPKVMADGSVDESTADEATLRRHVAAGAGTHWTAVRLLAILDAERADARNVAAYHEKQIVEIAVAAFPTFDDKVAWGGAMADLVASVRRHREDSALLDRLVAKLPRCSHRIGGEPHAPVYCGSLATREVDYGDGVEGYRCDHEEHRTDGGTRVWSNQTPWPDAPWAAEVREWEARRAGR